MWMESVEVQLVRPLCGLPAPWHDADHSAETSKHSRQRKTQRTGYTSSVFSGMISRFGLLPRLALSLILVGIVPLTLASIQLIKLNREAMTSQVLRTHSLAARATAERISAELRPLLSRLHALCMSPGINSDPRSPASRELLSGSLQADERIRGLVLLNSDGGTVLRVQHRGGGELIDWVSLEARESEPRILEHRGTPWLILDEELSNGSGYLRLIAKAEALVELLNPEDLGREAVLDLVSWEGLVIPDGTRDLHSFPQTLLRAALTGRIGGAGSYEDAGRKVLGAFAPVPLSPWVVISRQPAEVAEAAAMRMRRRALWTLGLVFCLVLLLIVLAYRNIIRPLKELESEQRKMAGMKREGSGNEVRGLVESFRVLQQRMKDREELGDVFLGRYLVINVIGQGAMGTVFRGWDPKLERPVALKTIRPRGEPDRRESRHLVSGLLREAVMAAGFSHPNIVGVYDVEDSEDAAFIAMEFINGISLAEYLGQRGRLTPGAVLHIALAVAEALAAAHERKIIHQDIKPGNILLGYDGAIKVVDFGISRTLSAALPSRDLLFGTPGYLPPEALEGEGFDTRGDLFAMGVVLYYCLTGIHPFLGSTLAETYEFTISRPVRDLKEILPGLNDEIRSLVMALISREPDLRPAPAERVAAQLRRLAAAGHDQWIPPEKGGVPGELHDETLVQIVPTTRIRRSSAFRLGP